MQPASPDPQFDFMLKNSPSPKRGLALPGMPKPVRIIAAGLVGIVLLVIVINLFSGRGAVDTQPYLSVLARGQEIIRVTELTSSTSLPLQDPAAQALAATVDTTLTSDQQQITNYLAANKVKVSKLALSTNIDKTTDDKLQAASQNNSLDLAYENYLKASLNNYLEAIKTAYASGGPNARAILKSSGENTNTLLTTPPLKNL